LLNWVSRKRGNDPSEKRPAFPLANLPFRAPGIYTDFSCDLIFIDGRESRGFYVPHVITLRSLLSTCGVASSCLPLAGEGGKLGQGRDGMRHI